MASKLATMTMDRREVEVAAAATSWMVMVGRTRSMVDTSEADARAFAEAGAKAAGRVALVYGIADLPGIATGVVIGCFNPRDGWKPIEVK